MSGYAANFRDLVVYQKARTVAKEIFVVSQRFPREEARKVLIVLRRCVFDGQRGFG
jgi:hypothetical protein